MNQAVRILKFQEDNIFIIKGIEGVKILQSIIPDSSQVDFNADKDLYYIQVHSWPHIKLMCLQARYNNPCKYRYVTQDEEEPLFTYDIDTFSLQLPE